MEMFIGKKVTVIVNFHDEIAHIVPLKNAVLAFFNGCLDLSAYFQTSTFNASRLICGVFAPHVENGATKYHRATVMPRRWRKRCPSRRGTRG